MSAPRNLNTTNRRLGQVGYGLNIIRGHLGRGCRLRGGVRRLGCGHVLDEDGERVAIFRVVFDLKPTFSVIFRSKDQHFKQCWDENS